MAWPGAAARRRKGYLTYCRRRGSRNIAARPAISAAFVTTRPVGTRRRIPACQVLGVGGSHPPLRRRRTTRGPSTIRGRQVPRRERVGGRPLSGQVRGPRLQQTKSPHDSSYLHRFGRYQRLANRRLYEACAALSPADYRGIGRLLRLDSCDAHHILVGDRVWMGRLEGVGAASERLDQILRRIRRSQGGTRDRGCAHPRLRQRLSDETIGGTSAIANMAGESHETPLAWCWRISSITRPTIADRLTACSQARRARRHST